MERQQDEGSQDRFNVSCPSCGAAFDAANSGWCECVTSERTPACPACRACLCRTAPAVRDMFWRAAPASLRRARWDLQVPAIAAAIPDQGVTRPLVLVVEDDPNVRRLAALVVQRSGYGVIEAGTGTVGLATARALRPDLVLTDALLPGMDGRDVCRALKADPATRAITVVIMTSLYTKGHDRNAALMRGQADDYLVKPIDPASLAALLRSRLGAPEPRGTARPEVADAA